MSDSLLFCWLFFENNVKTAADEGGDEFEDEHADDILLDEGEF